MKNWMPGVVRFFIQRMPEKRKCMTQVIFGLVLPSVRKIFHRASEKMPTLSGICHQVNADGFEARRRDEPTFFAQLSPGGSDGAFSDLDRSFDKLLSCLRMNKPQNFHTLVS